MDANRTQTSAERLFNTLSSEGLEAWQAYENVHQPMRSAMERLVIDALVMNDEGRINLPVEWITIAVKWLPDWQYRR